MLIYLFLYGFLGAALGSFATFLTYRFLNNQPVLKKQDCSDLSPHRSACPACKTQLSVLELFPVVSWLFLRGKCKTCEAKIPPFYPLTELCCIVFSCLVFVHYGWAIQGWFILASLPILCALFVIDLRRMILPDPLVFCLGMLGLGSLASLLWPYLVSSNFQDIQGVLIEYIGGVCLYGLTAYLMSKTMTIVLKKNAMGFGDVKFFIVSGLWLGISALPVFMILSGVFGVITALLWRVLNKGNHRGGIFPFGPALIVSFLTLLFYHDSLIRMFS